MTEVKKLHYLEWIQNSLFPRPCSAYPHLQYGNEGEDLVSSHEWRQDRKDGRKNDLIVRGALGPEQRSKPRYQVTYHMYLASGRWLSYTPSVEHVVGWKYMKRSMLALQIFTIFQLCHAHMRKDTRLPPLFRVVQAMESWAGPGNEAKAKTHSYTGTQK